jgi:hypothetical protein
MNTTREQLIRLGWTEELIDLLLKEVTPTWEDVLVEVSEDLVFYPADSTDLIITLNEPTITSGVQGPTGS